MRKLLFAMSAAAALGALAISEAERKHLFERRRIIAQTIEGDNVITTYTQRGKVWAATNAVRRVNAPIAAPKKYSKLQLIVAAKSLGKWEAVKAAIKQMGVEDEWNACQYITSDYPAYIAATNAVISSGIATQKEVEGFMQNAETE